MYVHIGLNPTRELKISGTVPASHLSNDGILLHFINHYYEQTIVQDYKHSIILSDQC